MEPPVGEIRSSIRIGVGIAIGIVLVIVVGLIGIGALLIGGMLVRDTREVMAACEGRRTPALPPGRDPAAVQPRRSTTPPVTYCDRLYHEGSAPWTECVRQEVYDFATPTCRRDAVCLEVLRARMVEPREFDPAFEGWKPITSYCGSLVGYDERRRAECIEQERRLDRDAPVSGGRSIPRPVEGLRLSDVW